jgi:glucan biosynthesis protein C
MESRRQSSETPGPADRGAVPEPQRWYFLDWVRLSGIILVFTFHCGRFFDHLWWHLKDTSRDARFTAATLIMSHWGMPLFFLIAGAASGLSRRASSRHTGSQIGARLRRLLVPFVFGVFVIVPPQVYFERLRDGGFHGSFLAFYPHYFDGLYFFGGNFSWIGHHLWFLPALLVVSVVARRLLAPLERDGRARLGRLAALCDRLGAPTFFGTPVLLAQLTLRRIGLVDPVCYVLFYAFGVLLAADPRFLRAIRRTGGMAFLLAAASSALYALMFMSGRVGLADLTTYSPNYILMQTLAGLDGWLWPQALLALFSRDWTNRPSAFLRYANEATMPFYVLHQTVIIAVGYYVLAVPATAPQGFAVIAAISLPLTLVIYELSIRRFDPVRVAFGMSPRRHE